jgi:hypothetical protein
MLSHAMWTNHTQELVSKLITNTYTFKHDPKLLYQVRAEIARKISANSR